MQSAAVSHMCRLAMVFRVFGLLLALALATSAASAHRIDLSAARGMLVGDTFTFAIRMAAPDAARNLPHSAREVPFDRAHFDALRPYIVAFAADGWEVRTDGNVAPPLRTEVAWLSGDQIGFRLSFLRLGARKIALRARHLATDPTDQRELVSIAGADGATKIETVLSRDDPVLEFEVSAMGEIEERRGTKGERLERTAAGSASGRKPERSAVGSFVWQGVQHIWTGYDHLLFLFSLLVVCRRFRSIVSIVSCFTLAHSVTLAIATLGLVRVSSAITEPAIAATIVFVAVENLVRRGEEPRGRWAVTFLFGLIHGFGFATVLRDLGVGDNGASIAVPLFAFNVGVELGQVSIAAAVLPLLWYWRKNATFVRIGVPVLSSIAAAAGVFWFLQRTAFA